MNQGLWVWPSTPRGQARVLAKVAESDHLMAALQALAKSGAGGLSDTGLDDVLGDSSEWITLWVVRQLTALGFIEYKVDFFGNPAVYMLTDLGRTALQTITGKPVPKPAPAAASPQPPRPAPPAAQQAQPKPAAAPPPSH